MYRIFLEFSRCHFLRFQKFPFLETQKVLPTYKHRHDDFFLEFFGIFWYNEIFFSSKNSGSSQAKLEFLEFFKGFSENHFSKWTRKVCPNQNSLSGLYPEKFQNSHQNFIKKQCKTIIVLTSIFV